MKRIALIIPANIEYAPFVKIYTNLLDQKNIKYDIILWNKKGIKYNSGNIYSFDSQISDKASSITRFIYYYKFSFFVKKLLKRNKYNFIIVFTIPIIYFIGKFLIRYFDENYIIDIRDHSIMVNNSIFKKVIKASALICISSNAFKEWLPKNTEYILSHNTENTENTEKNSSFSKPVKILAIGMLRDYQSNSNFIKSLGNNFDFNLIYSGDGPDKLKLETSSKHYNNIKFTGYYNKKDENIIVQDSDFVSIILNNNINSNSLITNRLYLAIINKKPVIVNQGSYQSEIVKEHKIGVILSGKNNSLEISEYINKFNRSEFESNCDKLLIVIKNDIDYFNNKISEFL